MHPKIFANKSLSCLLLLCPKNFSTVRVTKPPTEEWVKFLILASKISQIQYQGDTLWCFKCCVGNPESSPCICQDTSAVDICDCLMAPCHEYKIRYLPLWLLMLLKLPKHWSIIEWAIAEKRKVPMNKASLCSLLTFGLVSCSHVQHESSFFADVISKKFTWPASVGFSDQPVTVLKIKMPLTWTFIFYPESS